MKNHRFADIEEYERCPHCGRHLSVVGFEFCPIEPGVIHVGADFDGPSEPVSTVDRTRRNLENRRRQ